MQYQLKIAGKFYKQLQQHLFPGDGKEAVAIVLCGRYESNDHSVLLSHKIELIPHEECERSEEYVQWKTERLVPLLQEAELTGMAILKIHSHPTGYSEFSSVDDYSDSELFSAVYGWCESNSVHGSAIMLPNGEIFGRVFDHNMIKYPIEKIVIVGDELTIWNQAQSRNEIDAVSIRTIQAFGEGTYNKLKSLKVAVIGCSGTGSPTIEQLVRLGVSEIILIDPDSIELKNVNRILNTSISDALLGKNKAEHLAEAATNIGLGTKIKYYKTNLYDSIETLKELVTCDVIFGCVDTVDARHLLCQLCNFYLIPYYDLGVRLDADGLGGIQSITASVHYIQPGCSSLLSRGQYTLKRLYDDGLRREDPDEFADQEKRGYVQNANVDRPAVISINMQISSTAVNEFLNRLHPFKDETPDNYAKVTIDYCGSCVINENESAFPPDEYSIRWCGKGDVKPFLRMPTLSNEFVKENS